MWIFLGHQFYNLRWKIAAWFFTYVPAAHSTISRVRKLFFVDWILKNEACSAKSYSISFKNNSTFWHSNDVSFLILTKATFLVLEMLFKIEALASHEYIAHNHFIMDVVELHHVSVNSKPWTWRKTWMSLLHVILEGVHKNSTILLQCMYITFPLPDY